MYWIKQPTQPYNVLLYIQKTSYIFYDIAFGQYVSHVELTCIIFECMAFLKSTNSCACGFNRVRVCFFSNKEGHFTQAMCL